jgi:hypothetical protein
MLLDVASSNLDGHPCGNRRLDRCVEINLLFVSLDGHEERVSHGFLVPFVPRLFTPPSKGWVYRNRAPRCELCSRTPPDVRMKRAVMSQLRAHDPPVILGGDEHTLLLRPRVIGNAHPEGRIAFQRFSNRKPKPV